MEEPTDEMLSAIMREAAEDARRSNEEATRRYFEELRRQGEIIKKEQKG